MSSSSVNQSFLVFQKPLGGYVFLLAVFLSSTLQGAALACVSLCVSVSVCVCGLGRGSEAVFAVSPFWDQDRKWAQQRKHDLLSPSTLLLFSL